MILAGFYYSCIFKGELEEDIMAKIPKFNARLVNKKIFEAPTLPPFQRSTPDLPEFKVHYSKQGQAFKSQAQSIHIEIFQSSWLNELMAFHINLREMKVNNSRASKHLDQKVIAHLELWDERNSGNYEKKVYVLPKHLDEKVAALHLAKLGANMTKLSKEQADYISVPVESPYKPAHYRLVR